MKNLIISSFVVTLLAGTTLLTAQERQGSMKKDSMQDMMKKMMEQMPKPGEEHKCLTHCVGEWEMEGECCMMPGQPGQKWSGTEKVEMLGDFWVVAKTDATMMNAPFKGLFTLGYDNQKKKYVGTWIDSMGDYLWVYEGTMNKEKTVLTSFGEGPMPGMGSKMMKFKQTMEVKNKDHRVFTQFMQGPDGSWKKMMTINYRRK